MVTIECPNCRECFLPQDVIYKTNVIPEDLDYEELEQYAEDSGVEFDCPECEERVYLSDCELF